MKIPFVLVLGGARSGKSRFAERLLRDTDLPVTYLATAGQARDEEMATRIAAHRAVRPDHWCTEEVPVHLGEALGRIRGAALVDCLTLWLTNLMLGEHDVAQATEHLLAAVAARSGPVVAVSNEVGEGIVPATPLGRAFRDAQGVLNQQMAAAATDVFFLVAGCPSRLKPPQEPEFTL